jgi:hypothetical protein
MHRKTQIEGHLETCALRIRSSTELIGTNYAVLERNAAIVLTAKSSPNSA